jgi:hypothetical protein
VVKRASIGRIRRSGALQDGKLLEPAEERRPRLRRCSNRAMACGLRHMAGSLMQPAEVVVADRDQCIRGIGSKPGLCRGDRVVPEAGRRKVKRHVQVRLEVTELTRLGGLLQSFRRPSTLEPGPQVQRIALQGRLGFADRLL